MKIIVVIGGIGSGKSTVSGAFRDLGASLIDLDVVGHDILLRDDLKKDLVEAFGEGIIGEDGEVIRPELAKRAFVSEEKTELLNATTHPRLIEEAKRRLSAFEEEGAPATVIEISPYDGPEGRFGVFTDMADAVVAVVAPVEMRVQRAAGRFTEEDVRNRIARQASDEQRRSWATHVVDNDASLEELRTQVAAIWDEVTGGGSQPGAATERPAADSLMDSERAPGEVSLASKALEEAYNNPDISLPMLKMAGVVLLILLALSAVLVVLWIMQH